MIQISKISDQSEPPKFFGKLSVRAIMPEGWVRWIGAGSMREAEELSQVIGDIYDASLDPALWPNAIESICGYVGAASASLHSQDSIMRATDALFWWGDASSAPYLFGNRGDVHPQGRAGFAVTAGSGCQPVRFDSRGNPSPVRHR
jgi:hypothetical protein